MQEVRRPFHRSHGSYWAQTGRRPRQSIKKSGPLCKRAGYQTHFRVPSIPIG